MNVESGTLPAGTGAIPHLALVRQHLFDRADEDALDGQPSSA